MAIPGSLLEAVHSILNDCRIHELTTDIATADRIVFDLECCTLTLCNFITSGSVARPSMEYMFRELNQCISSLLVQWEIKLHSIESGSDAEENEIARHGRPKKLVNIELVRSTGTLHVQCHTCRLLLKKEVIINNNNILLWGHHGLSNGVRATTSNYYYGATMDSPMEYKQPPSSNNAAVTIICPMHLSQVGINSVKRDPRSGNIDICTSGHCQALILFLPHAQISTSLVKCPSFPYPTGRWKEGPCPTGGGGAVLSAA
jgi:hypothetical protein